jgi:hypothetical protein
MKRLSLALLYLLLNVIISKKESRGWRGREVVIPERRRGCSARICQEGRLWRLRVCWNLLQNPFIEALAKLVYFVILNEVKDLKLLKIRDSSRRSE